MFHDADDRLRYLDLLRRSATDSGLRLLGYCLMTNHIHLVAIPDTPTALADALGRAHGHYAQTFNRLYRRSGHLWQNRFYSCPLRDSHVWFALRYVEQNPVRARLTPSAERYPWSSAQAHVTGADDARVLDWQWWRHHRIAGTWRAVLETNTMLEAEIRLRHATRNGLHFDVDHLISAPE